MPHLLKTGKWSDTCPNDLHKLRMVVDYEAISVSDDKAEFGLNVATRGYN
jgi:hypothetical protein